MIDAKVKPMKYTRSLSERTKEYDFRSLDLSSFAGNYNWDELLDPQTILDLSFNSQTKFPTSVAQKFAERLALAKNRGLGINALHEKGYTGQGATVAIIDQPLLTSHIEIHDNLIHYEELGKTTDNAEHFETASQHGISVSSILCGKNIGVAPDAKLTYFAVPPNADTDAYIDAISRVIEYNKTLPDDEKIHTVSISYGFPIDKDEKQEVRLHEVIKQANETDMFVITTSLDKTHNLPFLGADRDISADLDNPNNYKEPVFIQKKNLPSSNNTNSTHTFNSDVSVPPTLLVPQDRVTVASPTGDSNYTYYTDGGMSWATPYLAGVYAIAKNTFPNLTPEKFFSAAYTTCTSREIAGRDCCIINAKNLMKSLEFSNSSAKLNSIQNKQDAIQSINYIKDNKNDR